MDSMFNDCKLLIYLDISNFDTTKVNTMRMMFCGCSSLISLDLSHFITSNVEEMEYMFEDCSSLISLDLSNFNVSSVTTMKQMFYNCSKLESLNLSNFKTQSNIAIYSIFDCCKSLIFLELSGFNIQQIDTSISIFKEVSKNIIICFKDSKWKDILNRYSIPIIDCYNIETSIIFETESEFVVNIGKDNTITEYNINKLLKLFDKSYIKNGNDIEMYIGKTRYSISSFEN